MELFPTSPICRHGRMLDECVWCNPTSHLEARSSDPATSHAAARSLDHTLKREHLAVLIWLAENGPATDDAIAAAMVANGVATRTETARRWVRTLRERHGMIVPALRHDGTQVEFTNESGRLALAWTTKETQQ